jgi:hypothetical protein
VSKIDFLEHENSKRKAIVSRKCVLIILIHSRTENHLPKPVYLDYAQFTVYFVLQKGVDCFSIPLECAFNVNETYLCILTDIEWNLARFNGSSIEFCEDSILIECFIFQK